MGINSDTLSIGVVGVVTPELLEVLLLGLVWVALLPRSTRDSMA